MTDSEISQNVPALVTKENSPEVNESSIVFHVVHNRTKHQLSLHPNSTIKDVKQTLEPLTNVPVNMQKLIFRGILSDNACLKDLKLPQRDAKLMLIGTTPSDAEQLRLSEATNSTRGDNLLDNVAIDSSIDWCEQAEHKRILERYGKPDNAMIGILNSEEILAPDECLTGLYDKRGQSLRLRVKPDTSELWLATKDVTHKFPLATIHEVASQPIKSHPEYHIMAFQLGPTSKSRYFVYWLPSQYVESIKTMVLQFKLFQTTNGRQGNH